MLQRNLSSRLGSSDLGTLVDCISRSRSVHRQNSERRFLIRRKD
jgi:hypothetical protein